MSTNPELLRRDVDTLAIRMDHQFREIETELRHIRALLADLAGKERERDD